MFVNYFLMFVVKFFILLHSTRRAGCPQVRCKIQSARVGTVKTVPYKVIRKAAKISYHLRCQPPIGTGRQRFQFT